LQPITQENGGLIFEPYNFLEIPNLLASGPLSLAEYQLYHRLLEPPSKTKYVNETALGRDLNATVSLVTTGSVIIISSSVNHCSLPNISSYFRCGFMVQFSSCLLPSAYLMSPILKESDI